MSEDDLAVLEANADIPGVQNEDNIRALCTEVRRLRAIISECEYCGWTVRGERAPVA